MIFGALVFFHPKINISTHEKPTTYYIISAFSTVEFHSACCAHTTRNSSIRSPATELASSAVGA